MNPRWRTELLYPIFQRLGPRDKPDNMSMSEYDRFIFEHHGGRPGYWQEGFLYLQQAIDQSIRKKIAEEGKQAVPIDDIELVRMPYPKYIDDVFLVALQNFLPLILVFSFIYSVINITKSIAHEKEKRLKESMKIMGLPNWLHWYKFPSIINFLQV
jgi:ATP-binding cassette subfamily A (ABC1) protein 3